MATAEEHTPASASARLLSLPPPRTAAGRTWNRLVQRNRVAGWVDDWWFERGRVACELGSFICEGLVYGIGFLVGFPAFAVVTAARAASNIDEIHILGLALRHRDFSIFDRAQTWQRTADGGHERTVVDDDETPRAHLGRGGRLVRWAREFSSDFWTERRRLPGFILGIGSPILGFAIGAIFHAPILVVAAVTYTTFALQMAPVVRNAILSAVHRTSSFINKPQTIPRRPARDQATTDLAGAGVALPEVPASLVPAAAVHADPTTARPARPQQRRATPQTAAPTVAARRAVVDREL